MSRHDNLDTLSQIDVIDYHSVGIYYKEVNRKCNDDLEADPGEDDEQLDGYRQQGYTLGQDREE